MVQGHGADLRGIIWWCIGAGFETSLSPNTSQPDAVLDDIYIEPENTRNPPAIVGNDPGNPMRLGSRSRHPGGVNVAMADGSTRFVAESIDYITWRGLGSRAGQEVVGEF